MYILFDIGGSKMRLAASMDGRVFGEPIIVKTPQDFDAGLDLFVNTARELAGGRKIKKAAGGIAGPLDRFRSMLVNSPNLPGWINGQLKEKMEKMLGAPVYLQNDTAVVGLGEAAVGAGKGYEIVAYVTISTGVGGARVVEGQIDRSDMGFEIGHQIIDVSEVISGKGGTAVCPSCDTHGHLEAFISGRAVERKYGKKPYEINDPEVWDDMAKLLAVGLNNVVVHWSPDIIVLGGSMMKKIGIPIERVRVYLKELLRIFPEPPPLKKAALGDIGGLHGALVLLNQSARSRKK